MTDGTVTEQSLTQKIATCPHVANCLNAGDGSHACSTVVGVQGVVLADHQVPEPWSGHLSTARVLFISCNPSISGTDHYPRWADVVAQPGTAFTFFDGRFDNWIDAAGIRPVLHYNNGQPVFGDWVRFWAAVKKRAEELLGVGVRPGHDYALTEVVHCKSRNSVGVNAAAGTCAGLYLGEIIKLSNAKVLVVLGADALPGVNSLLPAGVEPGQLGTTVTAVVAGRIRRIVALPHPNAHIKRKFSDWYSPAQLVALRGFLN